MTHELFTPPLKTNYMHFSGHISFKSKNECELNEPNSMEDKNIEISNYLLNLELKSEMARRNTKNLNLVLDKRLNFLKSDINNLDKNEAEIRDIEFTKKILTPVDDQQKDKVQQISFTASTTKSSSLTPKAKKEMKTSTLISMAFALGRLHNASSHVGKEKTETDIMLAGLSRIADSALVGAVDVIAGETGTRDDKADFLIKAHSAFASGIAAVCSPVPFSDLAPLAANTFVMCSRLASLYEAKPFASILYASQAIAKSQATGLVAAKTATSVAGWVADLAGGCGAGNGVAAGVNSTIAFNVTKGCGDEMKKKLEKGEVTVMTVIGSELMTFGFSQVITNFDKFSNVINTLSDDQVKAFFYACPKDLYSGIAKAGDILRYHVLSEYDKKEVARTLSNISSSLLDKSKKAEGGSTKKASDEEIKDAEELGKALDKLKLKNLPSEDKAYYMSIIRKWNKKYDKEC